MKLILAVDDSPEILAGINDALSSTYKVIGITNGKAALKFLENNQPDLFLLDIEMPDMDGFELAETIKNMARFSETPILLMTGHSSREYVFKALTSGIKDYLIKPASHEAIMAKVKKFLS